MADDWSDLPDHLARYLYRRTVSCLPEGVLETLKTLTPEELDALDRVGASLEAADADFRAYICAAH
jgi:hypothetical protein